MLVAELGGGAITLSSLALMLSLVEELGMLGGAIELSTLITIFISYASPLSVTEWVTVLMLA